MFRYWHLGFFAFAALLAGCSLSTTPVTSEPQSSAEAPARTSPQDARALVPLAVLQKMIASNPQDVGAILSRYRAPIDPTPWVKAIPLPGQPNRYVLPDGETFTGKAADDISSASADLGDTQRLPMYTQPTCPNPNTWSGSKPPTCDTGTAAGPFRRPVSPPGYSLGISYVTLPASMPGMTNSPSSDTAYIYLEPWPGPNTNNSEVGLQYSSTKFWYTLYIRTSGVYYITTHGHFSPGQKVVIEAGAYQSTGYSCSKAPCFGGEVISQDPNCGNTKSDCYDANAFPNPSYKSNCCIFARMTSIAQANGNNFTDGAKFGPLAWSGSMLANDSGTGAYTYSSWTNATSQSWPNDTTRIIVTNYSATAETDTIDLHS